MSRQKAGGREERKRERRLISRVDSSHLHGMGRGEVEEMWEEGGGTEMEGKEVGELGKKIKRLLLECVAATHQLSVATHTLPLTVKQP